MGAEFGQGVGPKAAGDRAGLNQADVDIAAGQFQPQGVGQAFHGVFAGVVGAAPAHGGKAQHGRIKQHAAVALCAHHRQHAGGELPGAKQIGFKLGAQRRARDVFGGAGLAKAGVVEQRIQRAASGGQHLGQRALDRGRVIHIQLQRVAEALGAQPRHIGFGAGAGEHPPAFTRQAVGDGVANAGRTTGDQDAVHECYTLW